MWYPEDQSRATITDLHKCEVFLCLSYLDNRELWEASATCSWFREAFIVLTGEGGGMLLKIANGNKDYTFPSLKVLHIYGERNFQELCWIDFTYKFPRLAELSLEELSANIALIPKIESITVLNCMSAGLWFENSNETYQTNIRDIFPNLKKLHMVNTTFSVSEAMSTKLESLSLIDNSKIWGDLAFPDLSELLVYRSDFLEEVVNVATGLETQWLNIGRYSLINPISGIIQLDIKITYVPDSLFPELYNLFPNLRRLCFQTCKSWDWEVNLREISPHRKLESLLIGSCIGRYSDCDVYGLEQLSDSNFPCLSIIITSARDLDFTNVKPNHTLEKLVVRQNAFVSFQAPLGISFPKLKIIKVNDFSYEKYLAGFT